MRDGTAAWLAVAVLLVGATAIAAVREPLSNTFPNSFNHPAIAYETTPARDPVAVLDHQLRDGRLRLSKDRASGYLRAVLEALNVPVESQMLVFVKDSVQAARIRPDNPRSLFFNESVAVGWVRGGFIELAAQDPRQGVIFYALTETLAGQPVLTRRNDCLTCHYSYSTVGVPGMLVRSVGQFAVDHKLPPTQRWGGWYVTGRSGTTHHLGNVETDRLFVMPPTADSLNWSSLDGKFDTSNYLSNQSDIAALLVFEHQMHMMNLLTRLGWDARVAAYEGRSRAKTTKGDAGGLATTPVSMTDAAREVVDYLLFVDEALLPDRVQGATAFAETFSARGPRDRQGRSLYQLDLTRRLARYPCSYMIYSELFESLPSEARDAVYRRMWAVLSGKDKDPRYARLSSQDRRAIVDILRDTKRDLPPYFRIQ